MQQKGSPGKDSKTGCRPKAGSLFLSDRISIRNNYFLSIARSRQPSTTGTAMISIYPR